MKCKFCQSDLDIDDIEFKSKLYFHSFTIVNDNHFYSCIIENNILIEEFYANDFHNHELILSPKENYFNFTILSQLVLGGIETNISGKIDDKSIVEIYNEISNRVLNMKAFI